MIRRPLRLTAVGTKEPLSREDKDFLATAKKHDYQIKYQQKNPKIIGKHKRKLTSVEK